MVHPVAVDGTEVLEIECLEQHSRRDEGLEGLLAQPFLPANRGQGVLVRLAVPSHGFAPTVPALHVALVVVVEQRRVVDRPFQERLLR